MKPLRYAGATAVIVIALTGCQAPGEGPTPAPSETSTASNQSPSAIESPSASPSPSPRQNDRGQVIKQLGEVARMVDADGEDILTMEVNGFDFIECDGVWAQEMTGYVLAVDVSMETSKDFVGNAFYNDVSHVLLPGYDSWIGYEPDGTKMASLGGGDGIINCFDDGRKLFPDYIGAGEKAKGQVLLNVTTKSGEVAFDPDGSGGWVWEYPKG